MFSFHIDAVLETMRKIVHNLLKDMRDVNFVTNYFLQLKNMTLVIPIEKNHRLRDLKSDRGG